MWIRSHTALATAVAALAVALLSRWLIPPAVGVTLYMRRSTRYVPAGVAVFWAGLGAALLLLLLVWHAARGR